jgi:hypothetical protein
LSSFVGPELREGEEKRKEKAHLVEAFFICLALSGPYGKKLFTFLL